MVKPNYLIKQLIVATQATSHAQAQRYEHQLKANLNQILACIENALRAIDRAQVIYCVPKLEIDLGELVSLPSHLEWEPLFVERIKRSLDKIWYERQYQIIQNDSVTHAWRLFEHFIRQGAWPWWSQNKSDSPIRLSTLWSELWPTCSDRLNQLLRTSMQHSYWLQRWIYHLSDQQLAAMLQTTLKTEVIDLLDYYHQFKHLSARLLRQQRLSETRFRETYWRMCIKHSSTPMSAESFLVELLDNVTQLLEQPYQQLLSHYIHAADAESAAARNIIFVLQRLATQHPTTDTIQDKITPSDISDIEFLDEEEETYWIPHAGVVLLCPFLLSLFQYCRLLKEQHFVNSRAQLKAIVLIYFLITGETSVEEDDLILLKLLCGLPVAAPIALTEKLTTKQIQYAEALLSSALQQWTILKNSSVDGLRRAFLQRPGVLKKAENLWCLYMEKQGCDALLDKLPWGFTPIKFPWMQEHLVVEWR